MSDVEIDYSRFIPDEIFAPRFYTIPKTEWTMGSSITHFSHKYLKPYRGRDAGKPLRLQPWQQWLLDVMFAEHIDGTCYYNEFVLGLPRKQGKSMLTSLIAVYHVMVNKNDALVLLAASDKTQAGIVFEGAKKFIRNNPVLDKEFTIRQHPRKEIIHKKTGGIIQVVSADDDKNQGGHPSLIIIDEGHVLGANKSDPDFANKFLEVLTSGSSDRVDENVLTIIISTAGENRDSWFGEKFNKGVKYSEDMFEDDEERDESFGFAWWGWVEGEDPFDESNWSKYVPNLRHGLTSMKDYRNSARKARIDKGKINGFIRYYLNGWMRRAGSTFISEKMWFDTVRENYVIPRNKETKITIGFDGSLNKDSTAIVICEIETGHLEVYRAWVKHDPDDTEWFVDQDEVYDTLIEILDTFDVSTFYSDSMYYESKLKKIQQNEKYWDTNISLESQGYGNMKPKAHQFFSNLQGCRITHDNNDLMKKHWFNALRDENGMFKKMDKSAINQIDILVASVLASAARDDYINYNGGETSPHSLG